MTAVAVRLIPCPGWFLDIEIRQHAFSAYLQLFCLFFEWATLRERSLERAIFCAVGLLLSSDPEGPVWRLGIFSDQSPPVCQIFFIPFFLIVWNQFSLFFPMSCFDYRNWVGFAPQSPARFFPKQLRCVFEKTDRILWLKWLRCPAGVLQDF